MTAYAYCMTMLSFRVDDGEAAAVQRWADELGIPHQQLEHSVAEFAGEILVVQAENGLQWYRPGVEKLAAKIDHFNTIELEGSHHLHMDADTTALVQLVREFLGGVSAHSDVPRPEPSEELTR